MKVSIEVIAKIVSFHSVGMIFGMLISIAWFIIHAKATRSLGTPAHVSLGTTPFWTLATVLSISSMMASLGSSISIQPSWLWD